MKLNRRFKLFTFKRARLLRQSLLTFCTATALFASATANPTGPTVSHGQVQITPGVQTQIQQLTDRAIIDWQSFSIGANESVRFLQPSIQAVVLNRVVGQDPSNILGALEANGNVFLINPNGILFGPNSVVNVGGLVASTLNLSNEDFLAGNYSFTLEEGSALASVINQGTIRISDAGYAVLTGPTVINEGLIVAKVGKVVLGAGERSTLNLDGRDLIHFALGDQVSEGVTLLAPGSVSDSLLDVLGVAPNRRADQLVRYPDGTVHLSNSSGTLVQAGLVSVDGDTGRSAGSILIDSSDLTVLTQGSVTSASGSGNTSSGGEILVLSHMDGNRTVRGFTDVQSGSLLAASGSGTGDGGFIEVSGDGLNLHGQIDLTSESGRPGNFLLDPVNVTIVDGDNAPTTVANPLIFDDVTNTSSTIIGDRWFSTQPFSSLTLQSSGDIVFDQSIEGDNPLNDNIVDFSRGASRTNITLTAVDGKIDFGDNATSYIGLDDFTLNAGGDIDFGNGVFTISRLFNVTAGGDINFDDSTISQLSTVSGNQQITASGGIHLGTSNLTFDSSSGGDPLNTTIRAGTGILSAAADGTASHSGNLTIDGDLNLTADSGNIELFDFDIDVLSASVSLGVSNELSVHSPSGSINLGESSIEVQGSIRFDAGNAVELGNSQTTISGITRDLIVVADNRIELSTAEISVPDRLMLLTNGLLSSSTASVQAEDIEVFGFDPTTRVVDYAIPLSNYAELSLESSGNIDLSVHAAGYIVVNHTGGGSLTLERAGLEGAGVTGSPGAVRSVNGYINITSDGEIRLGKSATDGGDPLLEALSSTASIILSADIITDVTNATATDIFSGSVVELWGKTRVGTPTDPIEVSAKGITLNLLAGSGNSGDINIVGDSDFLKVVANNSTVNIVETATPGPNNRLEIRSGAGQDELAIDPLGIENILVVDGVGISVGPVSIGSGQTIGIEAIGGSNIVESGGVPGNISSQGNLLLLASGNIGSSTAPILVTGGTVAAQAGTGVGNELHIASTDTDLNVGSVSIIDPLGNIAASGQGLSSGGDLVAQIGGSLPANLVMNENIASSAGGVVIRVANGDILQTGSTISGSRVGLGVNGNVGSFNGTVVEEASIQASLLALNVVGDVILDQVAGDLNLVGSVSAGGQTVTHTGAGDNLRIQNNNGSININAATSAGADLALVTGNALTVNAQTLPNSVTINGNLTAGDDLVIVSDGDIIYVSGIVTAPNLGLGAKGSIGAPTNPIQIQADNLTLNPINGRVIDADGYNSISSVTAVGVTVNQGTLPVVPPTNPTTGVTVGVTLTPEPSSPLDFNSPDYIGVFPNSFAQDNVDLVEDTLRDLLEEDSTTEDPTRPPLQPSEEDFLQHKFRR